MSTTVKVILLLSATLVGAQETGTAPPTTVTPSTGLNQTDKIIIGVTAGVGGIVIIGGIVFACIHSKKAKKERDQMYHQYLNKKIDFPHQANAYDNTGYISSQQQLAVNPQTSGYKAPVNPNQQYYNQQVAYPKGIPNIPSTGSIGYAPAPIQQEQPADVYAISTHYQPAPVQNTTPYQPAPAQTSYQPAPVQNTSYQPAPAPAPSVSTYQQPQPAPAPVVNPTPAPAPTPTPAPAPAPTLAPTPAPAAAPVPSGYTQSYDMTPAPTNQPASVTPAVNTTPARPATPPPSPQDDRPTFYAHSISSENSDESVTAF